MVNWKNDWARFLLFAYFTATVESQYSESLWNHGKDYSTSFTVINKGRLHIHMVLMYFEKMGLEECFENCMKHLSCRSINHNNDQKICEVCDSDFDLLEADTEATGWKNFAKDDLRSVDGGFTPWFEVGECSKKCGGGVHHFYRSCENPEPHNGGEECHGEYRKEERCNENPCPVHGNWGEWKDVRGCYYNPIVKGVVQSHRRDCNNPTPLHGGLKCKNMNGKPSLSEERLVKCYQK